MELVFCSCEEVTERGFPLDQMANVIEQDKKESFNSEKVLPDTSLGERSIISIDTFLQRN